MRRDHDVEEPLTQHLIIAIGNRFRGDDAAGLTAARELRTLNLPETRILEETGDGTILLHLWENAASVILIDTVSSGSKPGTIHRINLREEELPKHFFRYSTHHFSIADAVRLAGVIGKLPEKFLFYGIEGENFQPGTQLSPVVQDSINSLVKSVSKEIGYMFVAIPTN